jgi:glycosyltransferase involved in cell wall biosynthesis
VVVVDGSCFTLPYDYCLCSALQEQGCEVVLAQSEFLYATWDPPKSFTVWKHFYPRTHGWAKTRSRGHLWKLTKAAEHFFSMRSFAAEISRRKPDIVHFQWLNLPLLDRLFLRQLGRVSRLVLTLHNTASFHGGGFAQVRQRLGLARVLPYFDAIIVHTEFSRKTVLNEGWTTPEKIYVVPHGVIDYYQSFSTQEPPPEQDMQVLFFGNIEPYKGLDVLLRAFALLSEQLRRRARLMIAGRPVFDIAGLKRLSHSLGIAEQVNWDLRFVPDQEVARLFRSATMVALPYRKTDQSGVLLTAIAHEKPVIATRVGGIAETIQNGVHGVLVEPGNVEEMAQALASLLNDPARRCRMQENLSALRSGMLSWRRIAAQTSAIYDRLLLRDAAA